MSHSDVCFFLVSQHWKDGLKSYLFHRARYVHDAYVMHEHSCAVSLPATLEAREAVGHKLPRLELGAAREQEEGRGLQRMVEWLVTRAPREIFKETMGMLPPPRG